MNIIYPFDSEMQLIESFYHLYSRVYFLVKLEKRAKLLQVTTSTKMYLVAHYNTVLWWLNDLYTCRWGTATIGVSRLLREAEQHCGRKNVCNFALCLFLMKNCTTVPSAMCHNASVNKHLLPSAYDCLWDLSAAQNNPTVEPSLFCLLAGAH